MPSHTQTSLPPGLSPAAFAAGPATSTASQTDVRPPKVLARGPFWTRLPPLRTMTTTVAGSQSQPRGTPTAQAHGSNLNSADNSAPPSIVLPDRIATTRILLSDTQACVQMLSARMDLHNSRSEQALKEVQLAREAMDAGGEKTVAEIADVVYKCQAVLVKSMEAHGNTLDKASDRIAQLMTLSDAVFKLYEAQTALSSSLQSLQTQHAQLVSNVAPLEPLVRAIPLHIDASLTTRLSRFTDALAPALERAVERSVEHALARLPMAAYMCDRHWQEQQTPRGQKRKRAPEDTVHVDDVQIRSMSVTAPSSSVQTAYASSSPTLQRKWSGIKYGPRLSSGSSMRRSSADVVLASGTGIKVTNEVPTLAYPPQGDEHLPLRRSTRQPTFSTSNAASITGPANKRPRARSVTLIPSPIDGSANISAETDIVAPAEANEVVNNAASITTIGPATNATQARVRNTRPTPASVRARGAAARATLKSREPVSLSADIGAGGEVDSNVTTQMLPILDAGSEAVGPALATANLSSEINTTTNKSRSAQRKKKAPKTKDSGSGKRKGKKVTVINDTNGASEALSVPSATAVHSVEPGGTGLASVPKPSLDSDLKSAPRVTSSEGLTTGVSETALRSVESASVQADSSSGPLNVFNAVGNGETIMQPSALTSAVPNMAPSTYSLIDLMSESQEDPPTRGCEGVGGDAVDLAAALAHVNHDVNFTSCLDVKAEQRVDEDGEPDTKTEIGIEADIFNDLPQPQLDGSSSMSAGILYQSSSRPKRFLVVDNDSTAVDLLLDELFD